MINKKRRFAAIVATLFIILASILSVIPAVAVDTPEVDGGEAIVLYDKTHKRYIVEENGFAMLNTSTSAKIMMGLIACETLADRLDQTVTISEDMISGASGYSMSLSVGERIKIEDLLYGAICGSYNDAAYALAYLCGGSGFVDMMNSRALELGAKATNYVNPIGYPDSSSMITTAYDTLKIALAASDNELYMTVCSAVSHTVKATNKSDKRTIYNRNYLVCSVTNGSYYNSKCKGLNAGYSGEAGGWSIVTLIEDEDDGAEYVCVLLGGKENADGSEIYAYDSVNVLANWVCKTYNDYQIFPAGAQVGTTNIGLVGIAANDAPYIAADDLTVYVPAGCEVSYHVEIDKDLKAPIAEGTVIGKVIATADGDKVGEVDLLLKNSYEANSIMVVIDKIGSYTMSRAFVATIICFVVLLAAVLIYRYVNRYNSHGKYTRRR